MDRYVGEDVMRSIERGHVAQRTEQGWRLSWLPDRLLDRGQAITGMVLAELVGAELEPVTGDWPDYEVWAAANPDLAVQVRTWAGELGLSAGLAASMVRVSDAAALDAAADLADADQVADQAADDAGLVDVEAAGEQGQVEREYARDYEAAVQVADDADVVYGDGTAGPVRLLRDPYDVLADHQREVGPAGRDPRVVAEELLGRSLTRAEVADMLWEGKASAREAGAVFPDMLDKALLWGIDLDARVNLDAYPTDDDTDDDTDEDAAQDTTTTVDVDEDDWADGL